MFRIKTKTYYEFFTVEWEWNNPPWVTVVEIAATPVRAAIAFAVAICYCLRYPQAGRDTLHLAVVLSRLSSWQLHPPHGQIRFKKKGMLQKLILGLQGALVASNASRSFGYLQCAEWIQLCLDLWIRWELRGGWSRRSGGAGCRGSVTS